jgi:hypothetical protein
MSVGQHDRFTFSKTGEPDGEDMLLARQRMREDWTFVCDVDIPYVCGYSEDGKTVYFDRELPHFADIDGVRVDIWKTAAAHEMLEKTVLMRYGNEHYDGAHSIATAWEETCLKAQYKVDPRLYAAWFAPVIEKIGARKKYPQVPADLDLTPYHDEDDQTVLDRMTFVENPGKEVILD